MASLQEMIEKRKIWKKPFEGCIKIKGKGYTDDKFHDVSEKDDKKFIDAVKTATKIHK